MMPRLDAEDTMERKLLFRDLVNPLALPSGEHRRDIQIVTLPRQSVPGEVRAIPESDLGRLP